MTGRQIHKRFEHGDPVQATTPIVHLGDPGFGSGQSIIGTLEIAVQGPVQPDESVIAAAVPDAAKCIGLLDGQLAATPYLAGSAMSLADLFVLPAINYLAMVPEGGPLLESAGAVTDWAARMQGRDSAQIALAA